MAATTTVKVTSVLRDRINDDARSLGLTPARFLERLVDEHEYASRLEAVRQAYANLGPEDEYVQESAAWQDVETEWPA